MPVYYSLSSWWLFSTTRPQQLPKTLPATGRPSAVHVLSVSGVADVCAYLISLITGAPTSQCNSATQGASVLLVLTGTPWWWNCFTKSHKSYCGWAAASFNRQWGYQKAAGPRRNSWIFAVCGVAQDLKATNINCIDSGCLFYSTHWEISECIACLVHTTVSLIAKPKIRMYYQGITSDTLCE